MNSRVSWVVLGALLLCLVTFAASVAIADIAQIINYQGRLTDGDGNPVPDDVYEITFSLYGGPYGSEAVWTSGPQSVTLEDGLFNYEFGSHVTLPDTLFAAHSTLSLGIKVGESSEMLPWTHFCSVPWAYHALRADTAGVVLSAGGWVDDGAVVKLAEVSDNVGVGTDTPTEKLDVEGNIHASFTVASGNSITIDGTADEITASSGTLSFGDENLVTTGMASIGPGHTVSGAYTFIAGQDNTVSADHTTVAGGWHNRALGSAAAVAGGWYNTARAEAATVGGGSSNDAAATGATICGGSGNDAEGGQSVIGGGLQNSAIGPSSVIGGGQNNSAGGPGSIVGGGAWNVTDGYNSIIGGGYSNEVNADYSAILGGVQNSIGAGAICSYLFGIRSTLNADSTFMVDMPHIRFGDESTGYEFPASDGASGQLMATDGTGQLSWVDPGSTGGGWADDGAVVRLETAADNVGIGTSTPSEKLDVAGNIHASGTIKSGASITIDGGTDRITASSGRLSFDDDDLVTTGKATIGPSNTNTGASAFVAGISNSASGDYNTVSGGENNQSSDYWSTVGGGSTNTVSARYCTVAGGSHNVASLDAATVAGGRDNAASQSYTSVGGGWINTASGYCAVVGGGYENQASGDHACIPGGTSNTAGGSRSFAAGRGAQALHDGAWVWADNIGGYFTSTAVNQFIIRATGGVGIGTANPTADLHVVGDICYTGTIGACSDVRYKDDIKPLSGGLETVLELDGVNFQWRQDEFPEQKFSGGVQIGFIAQDVMEVVPQIVQEGKDGYYSVDYGRLTPVLVEAIKELQTENDALKSRLDNADIRLSQLTAAVQALQAQLAEVDNGSESLALED